MTPSTPRLLAWPTGALAVAVAGAAGVGELTVRAVAGSLDLTADPSREPVRSALEAAVALGVAGAVAALAGALTAVVLWVAGLALAARRCFPAGRRAVPVLLAAGSGVVLAWVVITAALSGALDLVVAAWTVLVVWAAAGAVYPWWGHRVARDPGAAGRPDDGAPAPVV